MKKAGVIRFRRRGLRVFMTIETNDITQGLGHVPGLGVKSVHFGTRLRGDNIKKGEGYGWDGNDRVTARKIPGGWKMAIPVRDNDPKNPTRRFIKGNIYIRTLHHEIVYADPRRWTYDPPKAFHADGMGGFIMEIDVEEIPKEKNGN